MTKKKMVKTARHCVTSVAATLTLGVVLLGGCAAFVDDESDDGNTKNDIVYSDSNGYTEYFKKEGSGKNYLYTRTEWDDETGRHCVVVTGASETSVAIDCSEAKR